MKNITHIITLLFVIGITVCSCTKQDLSDSSMVAVAIPTVPVALTLYGSAYTGKAGFQNTSIMLNEPDFLYSMEINQVPYQTRAH